MDLVAKNRCIIKADILEDKNTKQFPILIQRSTASFPLNLAS